jgi:hypothetical protein
MSTQNNRRLLSLLEKSYPDYQLLNGCVEPGYDDKPVILANWNNVDGKLYDSLENHGFSCEWEDEWITCDNCYKAFRSSPDSYGWEMYGYIGDGFATCGDCIEWEDYLESLENQPRKAVTCTLFAGHEEEITSRYTLVKGEYESGLHPGQNDNPASILESLLKNDPNGRYLFVIDGQGQFDIEFSVYKKAESAE